MDLASQHRFNELVAKHKARRELLDQFSGPRDSIELQPHPEVMLRRSRIKRLTWLLASAMGIGLALMGYRGF